MKTGENSFRRLFIFFSIYLCSMTDVVFSADESNNQRTEEPDYLSILSSASTTDSCFEVLCLLPGIRYKRTNHVPAQPISLATSHMSRQGVRKGRLVFAAGSLASINYYAYQKFKNIWWNHPKTGFHFYRGWRQTDGWYDFGPNDSLWHHMDKLGHYFNARLASLLLADTAHWIGFRENPSQWIGAAMSWLLYLQIEIFDGQFEQWGFSLGDLAANTAGAFMPLLSTRYPFIQKFTLKLSYSPLELQQQKYVVEDYAGMTFWLTSNPQNFLPRSFDSFWPDFLNVALGYSVSKKTYGDTELYFGLDYDLTKIETRSPFLRRVLYYLNYIHFPAPAIKISPQKQLYLFYY